MRWWGFIGFVRVGVHVMNLDIVVVNGKIPNFDDFGSQLAAFKSSVIVVVNGKTPKLDGF